MHAQLQALFFGGGTTYCGQLAANNFVDVPSGYSGGGYLVTNLIVNNSDRINSSCTARITCYQPSPTSYEVVGNRYIDKNHGDVVFEVAHFSDTGYSIYLGGSTNRWTIP